MNFSNLLSEKGYSRRISVSCPDENMPAVVFRDAGPKTGLAVKNAWLPPNLLH